MRLLARLLEPKAVAYAHCDLPCGIYDPAQARIEAESVKAIDEKYQQNTDPEFRARALIIKEQRSGGRPGLAPSSRELDGKASPPCRYAE
jgi:nickel superoxide dismutase